MNVRCAYHSHEGGTQIMQTIAHTISRELRAKLQSAEFWGLLFDGSDDITKAKQEIVYILSVSSKGEFTSAFLGLFEPGADWTARVITDGLLRLFQDAGLDTWTKRLVAVCTDGAAVNVSMYNGTVPKLHQLVAAGDFIFTSCALRTHWKTMLNQLITMSLIVRHLISLWSSCCSFIWEKEKQKTQLH